MKTRPLVLPAALAAVFFSTLFHGLGLTGVLPWHIAYNDILHLYEAAVAPGWPALDRPVEYPILTGLFLKTVGVLQPGVTGYYLLTSALLGAFALAATALLSGLASDQRRVLRFWCLAPTLWVFAIYNWDLIPVLCVVAALACAARGRDAVAGACLALGFSAKLYPILYLAPLLASRRLNKWAAPLAGFALTAAAVNLPFAWANFSGWSYVFAFNGRHPPNADSPWSPLRLVLGQDSAALVNALSLALFVGLLAFVLRRMRGRPLTELAYAATLAFLIAGKMFSPQYLLWLLPFFVLVPVPTRWFYALEFSNLAVLFLVLHAALLTHSPRTYWLVMAFVAARHACLIALLARAAREPAPHARARLA